MSLFEGLYIAENKALCDEYMGKYPVIFLSLKSVEGLNFEAAKYRITELIGREAQRFDFLLESDNLSDDEKLQYKAITGMQNGKFSMDEDILGSSIQILSYLLCRHFGQKAVILIDEYDVPLDKAFENGYYREMVSLIRGLLYDQTAGPQDFWSNSSDNAIVRRLIDKADVSTKNEIERLIAGESIEKDVAPELTYDEIDKSIENLWSVLFTTGYLTHKGRTESGKYRLVIPNREVRNLFVKKIREWLSDVTKNDGETLDKLCNAFVNKELEKIEEIFGDYLWNTISIRDTAVAKEKKENFYHGILLGLLGYKSSWLIKSNAESGTGYSDILVEVPTNRTGIVIELKYAENGDLDAACEEALKQIKEKDYVAKLKQDGMKNFIRYGIACFKKVCKVALGE